MSDVVHEPSAEAHRSTGEARARPAGRGIAVMLVTVVAAATMIFVGDRWLRDREAVVEALTTRDVQVWLPFNAQLTDRVDAKNTWNSLHARLAAQRGAGHVKEFVKTGFELDKFIASELDYADPRRKQVLLDVVAVAGPIPEAADAYWSLLDPVWRDQVKPQYPTYATALTNLYTTSSRPHLEGLVRLAGAMQTLGEADLELKTLQLIASRSGVNMVTEDALTRLHQRLPSADPLRVKLEGDLAAYKRRRDELVDTAKWYQQFELMRRKPDLTTLERHLSEHRSRPASSFTVSAQANLVQLYLRAGRFADADRVRRAVANTELDDAEECFMVAELLTQQTVSEKQKRPTTTYPGPDLTNINVQRWRGLLADGKTAQAASVADELFAQGMPLNPLRAFAEAETQRAAGALDKLSPRVTLQKRTSDLPQEIATAGEAWFASFKVDPVTKPPGAAAVVEMWLTPQHLLFIGTYAEPAPTTRPSAAGRDPSLATENRLELFFNPDRWVDYYSHIAVSEANAIYDAHYVNADPLPRRRYAPDKSLNLAATATSSATSGGWQQRVMFPRDRVMPLGAPAVRFNVRRIRLSGPADRRAVAVASWTRNASTAEHRPEQFGWILLPKP